MGNEVAEDDIAIEVEFVDFFFVHGPCSPG
jgi:hypothetical protein